MANEDILNAALVLVAALDRNTAALLTVAAHVCMAAGVAEVRLPALTMYRGMISEVSTTKQPSELARGKRPV